MDRYRDSKRRKDRHDSDDNRREKGSKKRRSRSRSNERDSRRKRRHSRSKSPNAPVKQEKRDAPKDVQTNPTAPPRKAKETDMLNTRTGGAYIPPARLRLMQEQITDKSSVAYQRLAWEALKKSIHGHINKINVGNIGIIIKELLKENIVRGRGLLCRSVIQAQAASPTFTNVYAALVAAVNSRFPNIGELLLKRLVIQFKRGFKRNDKPMCIASASFIAHLVNQRVAHEILALELLTLLVETPTDDSVEVSIAFLKECGQKLTEVSSKGVNAIFEMLRNILHEGQLDKRVQYMIEVMFQVWKDGFKDHPAVIEELELVPEEDQFTHLLMLDDATDSQDILNVFKFDDKYEENEQKYKGLCKEILGSDAESGEEGSDGSGSEESEGEEEEEKEKEVTIIDNTETNLVALRRTIYLTINSSLDFEECAHKLMKMQLKPGQEIELCHMFLDCCAEQRTYEKFYGLLAQRFCNINRIYISPFEEIFKDSYSTAHRLDTNRLRNVSKFFAHLLFTDSISWEVLECVKLNEEDTTSSSRIYIKILFQELAEYMGLKKLNDRLQDPTLQGAFSGIFPRDNPKNTRFSINFFTSIGLGGLTDELREHLKQMPKNVPAPITDINIESETSSDSSSSSESSSSDDDSSSSDSDGEKQKKEKKKKKSTNTPKPPEPEEKNKQPGNVERWGHDGFYDTYGKDARRVESRSDRPYDNNFRPRQDYRNNDEGRRNNFDQRNGSDRNRNAREGNREKAVDVSRKESEVYDRNRRYHEDGNRNIDNNERDDRRRNDRNEYRVQHDDIAKKGRDNRREEEELSRKKRDKDGDSNRRRNQDEQNTQSRHKVYDESSSSKRDGGNRRQEGRQNNDEYSNRNRENRNERLDKRDQEERRREHRLDDDYSRSKRDEYTDNRDDRHRERVQERKKGRDEHNNGYEHARREKDDDRRKIREREDRITSSRVDEKSSDLHKVNKERNKKRDSSDEEPRTPEIKSHDHDNLEDGTRSRKQLKKDKENFQDSSHSDNDNKNRKDKKKDKNKERKKRSKEEKSDSEEEQEKGGRYWDNFDIETKKGSLLKTKHKVR